VKNKMSRFYGSLCTTTTTTTIAAAAVGCTLKPNLAISMIDDS